MDRLQWEEVYSYEVAMLLNFFAFCQVTEIVGKRNIVYITLDNERYLTLK